MTAALWTYVDEIENQTELLATAKGYDDVCFCDSPEAVNANSAWLIDFRRHSFGRNVKRRRHWTRQDRNRRTYQLARDELYENCASVDEYHDQVRQLGYPRMRTRVSWFVGKFSREGRSICRNYHGEALSNAVMLGAYANTLAPLLVEMSNVHVEFLASYPGEEAFDEYQNPDWDSIAKRHEAALENLKQHLPARTATFRANVGSSRAPHTAIENGIYRGSAAQSSAVFESMAGMLDERSAAAEGTPTGEEAPKVTAENGSHELITLADIVLLSTVVERQTVNNRVTKDKDRPDPVIPNKGTRPASYNYSVLRNWFIKKWPESERFLPSSFREATIQLKARSEEVGAKIIDIADVK